jgi:hypothetical protein
MAILVMDGIESIVKDDKEKERKREREEKKGKGIVD